MLAAVRLGALVFALGMGASCGAGTQSGVALRAGSTCAVATAAAPTVEAADPLMVGVRGSPFGVATTRDGRRVLVATDSGLVVYEVGEGPWRQLAAVSMSGSPAGLAVTHDGRYALVANGRGVAVVDLELAGHEGAGAVVGTLDSRGSDGATEVAVAPDDRHIFVTYEKTNELVVFDLRTALAGGFGVGSRAGAVVLGRAPVGLAFSPDGSLLYVTSQSAAAGAAQSSAGILSVIDVAQVLNQPERAVVSTVDAGRSPVRVDRREGRGTTKARGAGGVASQLVVLPLDERVATTWGHIEARAQQRGRPHPVNDSWIAAVCIVRDHPMITFNVKDFEDYAAHEGLQFIDGGHPGRP